MGMFLFWFCFGTACNTIMFSVASDATISCSLSKQYRPVLSQGTLTEGEGSVQLTSFYWRALISCFWYWKNMWFLHFYKTSYLNKEVNHAEPSPSVRVPCRLSSAHFMNITFLWLGLLRIKIMKKSNSSFLKPKQILRQIINYF